MRSRARAVVVLLALVSPRGASAHLAPSVLGVVAEENGEPTAVRLAHGLAELDAQGRWRFVCPHTWEGPDAPLALAYTERRIIVIAATNAWELDESGGANVRPTPGVTALNIRKLARGGDAVFALASASQSSIVVRFDDAAARPVLMASRTIDSIVANAQSFEIAYATNTGVMIESYAHDGTAGATSEAISTDAIGSTIALERSGDTLYAVFAKADTWTLARIDGALATTIATSTTPIVGPVRAGDRDYVIANGKLEHVEANGLVLDDESRGYTCADSGPINAYVCARTELYRLGAGGALELVFDMASVKGPRLAHFDEGSQIACTIEWTDFAREAGLDPTIPDDENVPKPQPKTGCDCRTAGEGGSSGWLLAGLISAMIFAKRRAPDRR
jgi:MYXO-CTERM domain-containing protein